MAFRDPIVSGEEITVPGIRSEDYAEGTAGWRLGREGSAQIAALQVLTDLGAANISADAFNLNGEDLQETLDALPRGVVAYAAGSNAAGGSTAPVNAETMLFVWAIGQIYTGRTYKVTIRCNLTTAIVSGEIYSTRIRWASGTNPTLTSPVLAASYQEISPSSNTVRPHMETTFLWFPGADNDQLRFGLTGDRHTGTTGNLQIKNDDPLFAFQMWLEDLGAAIPNTGLSQLSKAPVGGVTPPPDPDPTTTYTNQIFRPLWSASYDSDGGYRAADTSTPYCYQGYYSSTHGDTRSAFGDFQRSGVTLASALSGATNVTIKLTFKVAHTYYNSGSTFYFGTSPTNTKTTWTSLASKSVRRTSKAGAAGSTYTITLPAAMVNDFVSGNAKTMLVGDAPSNSLSYYGYLYGPTQSGAPYLTVTYTK